MRSFFVPCLAWIAFLTPPASSAVTTPPPSDVLLITGPDGVTPLTDVNGHPTSAVIPETNGEGTVELTVAGSLGLNAGAHASLGFAEVPSGLSDLLTITTEGLPTSLTAPSNPATAVTFTFESLPEGTTVPDCGNAQARIHESGKLDDVTGSLMSQLGGQAALHVLVQSDISEVPEPSTAVLLAAGLGCTSFLSQRRRTSCSSPAKQGSSF